MTNGMDRVRAKKSLGQHFLKERSIAERVAATLSGDGYGSVLEIGPGMGILTGYLIERQFPDFRVIEIDTESVEYLRNRYSGTLEIIKGDFLSCDLANMFPGKLAITGNFPYNISSQIIFRVLENRDRVVELSGMFQREVAERICAPPGSKVYGILSVLTQAFYETKYLFTVSEGVFSPPPKVKSGVIFMRRREERNINCDEELFFRVVKAAFNQRRKMLRNSIRSAFRLNSLHLPAPDRRPEQLSVEEFSELTRWISENLAD